MASLTSALISLPATTFRRKTLGLKLPVPKVSQIPKITKGNNSIRKSGLIPCAITAHPETLSIVKSTIAKQLSIEEGTVTAETKFVDLGADSLDTVEIMMALEEKFGVSIGESGAENIASVQDAADLIEEVKAAAT
ncbi:hypothetical protein ACJIZ3_013041 [Penstemon smallii]|uniref:Acyl carrier protein n=1 Tax=Penstemon smallii TaxID=265156 RepID=A0ABD3UNU8_9LAMI